MREIKFRGQTGTTEGKKWVFGHYYRVKSFFNDNEGHYISTIRSDHLQDYNIDENTLGQYTGLKDKNGKEIYEGDIVKIDCPTMKMQGKIFYSEDGADFRIYDEIEDFEENLWYLQEEYEVIGNIYENPELLEE